ncbi:MAG: 2-oxo-4-hydroxy-4-carboxy-5-ureidoimidazoline decarboxylase [Gaiellaceae bacterium]
MEELERLFSGRSRLVDELAERQNPLAVADEVAAALPEEEKIAALNTHPRIGEASAEQRGEVPEELAELNRAYEEKFGFKFVVFVAGRPRGELVPVLRERLERTREEELATGLAELVAIARDRWIRT